MARVFVGIGSNVSPERHVGAALAALVEHFGGVAASPVYRSCAVGFDGDDFVNLVVSFESELPADAINRELHSIERQCGREKGSKRFAPRVIDLDLLLVGEQVLDGAEGPELPRGEILDYAFVLRPLAELAPEAWHPVESCTVSELWERRRETIDQGDLQFMRLDLPEGVRGNDG